MLYLPINHKNGEGKKLRMRHLRFATILLLLIFCLLPIISILMIHHLTLTDTLCKMGKGSFGKSYSYISIKEPNCDKKDLISVLHHMRIDFALCLDSSEDDSTIRAFYFNNSYANLPMESGRFFKPSDFVMDNYVAVVGKGKKSDIYLRENKQYIDIFGKEYLILGIIGYQDDTVIDKYVFVNMLTDLVESAHIYLIDYISNENSPIITDRLVSLLLESGIEAMIMTTGESFSESIIPSIVSVRWFIGLLLSCFICLVLVSMQWIDSQKTEICIRRLVGASIKDIVCLILGKYVAIAFISFVIGFVYCNILYPAYFNSLINGYLVCVVFIAFFILWSIWSVLKEPIEEAIK